MYEFSRTPSGIVAAEQTVAHEPVARALRAYDDALRLVPAYDIDRQVMLWKVYSYRGDDQDAVFICSWTHEDGTPRPLSMNLVERVKQLDLNTRSSGEPGADEHNRRLVEERRRDLQAELDAAAADHAPYIDRGRVSVAAGISRKQGYLRNRHLPETGRR